MKRVERSFPLPHLIMNKNFKIESLSDEAVTMFGEVNHLLEIMDEGSLSKIKRWVTPEVHKLSIEIALKPLKEDKNPVTCDMHVKWKNDLYAEVLIIPKDEQLSKITKTMDQLRSRLNDTNFQLLEEKEKLEEAIQHGNRLSAPFIRLTEETALIPLFGHITADKMYTVEEPLLHATQNEDTDKVLFDFTAVGQIDEDGAQILKNLMTSLCYMGLQVIITGIRPEQVKRIQIIHFSSEIIFMNSLHQALKKYCSY
ncbi:STAS domain-containing protein [Halobacillus trueperi]|uniref:RsbT co-antagonist protein RsbR n=3 Tax=Halobacillus TaxID=45667 RepID=A0A1H0TB47_HALAD|nr:STAS domain-containing protein [Halobacillus trueperi]RDY70894.1 STAS domain-containing protein [Halobacillus trueperi]SDP51031.1 rsbT co-antagonist protein RsbR [Halobacillus aidingensis]